MRIIKKQNDKKQERELKLLILFLTLLLVIGIFIIKPNKNKRQYHLKCFFLYIRHDTKNKNQQ